jgi:ribosomal protein S18 acetylase RimI-like enzyme
MDLSIRPTRDDDWQAVRALRLEMLHDTPMGFAETYETALAHDETVWRERGARGTADRSISLAAIADGRWVGTMGGYLDEGQPLLVGVYVSPAYRGGTGVAELLLAGVERWAQQHSPTLTLHVHADNLRARRFYEKHGYAETGVRVPYVLNPDETELEMRKAL